MNLYVNEARKGEEWPLNEFILLDSPTLLAVIPASDREDLG